MYLAATQARPFASLPQLAGAVDDDLMSHRGVSLHFDRDEEIYGQEEDAHLIYRVVKGAVRTSRLMTDGRRQIGDFYYPGDVFGVEPEHEHVFSAEALCDSVILVLTRSALRDASGTQLDRLIWTAAGRELRRAHDHVLLLGRKTACEKVATFLMSMLNRSPGAEAHLPMGRQDMADYLGLTIETVSRMLTQLQTSEIIEFHGLREFQVRNRQSLARLAA
jgi:CRP/FNR family nitrogen fixation transcriptional regulator